MHVIHALGMAAAMLLLLELLVVVLIFFGVAGGLAFGLHWVRGKLGWASDKANGYLKLGQKYVHLGTGYAAKPFILTSGFVETGKGTAQAIRARIRELRSTRLTQTTSLERPAARPVEPSPDDTVIISTV